MTARRKLKEHMRQLTEIRDIMDAMKNLALLETHKLGNLLANQQTLFRDLETIAADFLTFFPWPTRAAERNCWILFGAERGFCGDFNNVLLKALEAALANEPRDHLLIAIGSKLHIRLQGRPGVEAFIEGPDVAEEVIPVLNTLVTRLGTLQKDSGLLNIRAVFHDPATGEVRVRALTPSMLVTQAPPVPHAYPPLLNVPPASFLSALLERYLFVSLQEIACASLMAENQQRIQHMSGAVSRLEETTERLTHQYHIRRQEDITEEIEVILLNAGTEATP